MRIEEIITGVEKVKQKFCASTMMFPSAEECEEITAMCEAIALLKTHQEGGCAADSEAQPSEPLTQKQLKFMIGDPVWIVRENGVDRWALIRYANSGGINTYGCGFLVWEDLGKIWFPYRRPPKEG